MSYEPKVYREQGGDKMIVASGGEVEVQSGGILDLQAGAIIILGKTDTEPSNPVEGQLYWDDSENMLKVYTGSAWVAVGAGTFAGGNITDHVVMANGKNIRSSTTTAQTTAIEGYDVDGAAYVNGLKVTNGNTVAVTIGAATASVAIASTGINVSTAGAVTGVTTLAASGNVTAAGVTMGSTGSSLYTAVVDITDAQIKALRATPKELIAAPGANAYIEVLSAQIIFDYGSGTAYTESDDNLIIGYNNGGTQIGPTIETTGFIDQTADMIYDWQNTTGHMTAAATVVNKNVALKNSGDGEYGGGSGADSAIRVIISYRVHTSLGL